MSEQEGLARSGSELLDGFVMQVEFGRGMYEIRNDEVAFGCGPYIIEKVGRL